MVYAASVQRNQREPRAMQISKKPQFVDYLNIVLLPAECEKQIFSMPSLEHGTIFLTCKSDIKDSDSGI
jgi:hypothetical protein